jgi:hypothetical protein
LLLLGACSSPSPSATRTTAPVTRLPTTTVPDVALCSASSVSASVDFTQFAGSNTSPAGAVLFHDTGTAPCALRGVPQVQVESDSGQLLPTFEAPGPANIATAVLTPAAPSGTGSRAASSVTFSAWGCGVNSFTLEVRFPQWANPVPAPTGATGGSCTAAQDTDETIYVGPVTTVTG